jgi:prepilin-type N-terminal cleavage/methylation domain-containing protein
VRGARGFTLVELVISLAIIGLLLGMLMVPLNAQVDQRRTSDTQRELQLISEALMGFAVANGRLPCPAVPTTANTAVGAGLENKPGTDCAGVASGAAEGVIPWATLGVPETDAWGRRFTYRVTAEFANDPPVGGMQSTFTLTDNGNATVTNGAANIATSIAAVMVSHGKNGAGAYLSDGTRMALGVGDEGENSDADNTFVSRTNAPDFDDLVGWISPNVVKSRMVAGNRLP